MEEQQGEAVPVEYLNTFLPSGLPPHRLTLKIGAPIMLPTLKEHKQQAARCSTDPRLSIHGSRSSRPLINGQTALVNGEIVNSDPELSLQNPELYVLETVVHS